MISDTVKSLQCDRCNNDQWKCIDCLNLTTEVYDQLLSDTSCNLKWFCEGCDKIITGLDTDGFAAAVANSVSPAFDKCVDMIKEIGNNILQQMAIFEEKLDDVKKTCNGLQSVRTQCCCCR